MGEVEEEGTTKLVHLMNIAAEVRVEVGSHPSSFLVHVTARRAKKSFFSASVAMSVHFELVLLL